MENNGIEIKMRTTERVKIGFLQALARQKQLIISFKNLQPFIKALEKP